MPYRFFLILVLFLGAGCQSSGPPQGVPPGGMAMPVETMTLQAGPLMLEAEYVGQLESREAVTLHPRVSATVQSILVTPGESVTRGQALVRLEDASARHELQRHEAAITAAQAEVQQSRKLLDASTALRQSSLSNIDYQRAQLKRFEMLYHHEAASLQQVQQATDAVNKAHADLQINNHQIEAQRQAVLANRQKLAQAREAQQAQHAEWGYYTITAPFSGTVGDIPIKLGDSVSSQTPMATITNNRALQVLVSIPVDQARTVRHGSRLRLLSGSGEHLGEARVYFVDSAVTPGQQTVLLRAMVTPAPGTTLRTAETVRVRLARQIKHGLKVPVHAVSNMAGQDFVFVMRTKDGQHIARQIPVTLGDILGPAYVVEKGLSPGDTLITSGIQKIQDNVPVKPVNTRVH